MADEPINELITIADGSNAEAKPLRQNFTYLQSLITQQQSSLDNKLSTSAKGAANGVCPLNASSKINSDYIDFNGATSVIDGRIDAKCVKLTDAQTIGGSKTFSNDATFSGYVTAKHRHLIGTSTTQNDNSTTGYVLTTVSWDTGENGYVRFGNNLIIQWGENSTNNYTKTVTLPHKFSDENKYQVVVCDSGSDNSTAKKKVTNQTKSGFTVRSDYNGSDSFQWIAIGY